MSPSLTDIFNKFVVQEANVKAKLGADGTGEVMDQSPVILEMKKAAEENGLYLSVIFDFSGKAPRVRKPTDHDYQQDRINVYVTPAADGKNRVSSFNIG